ncbi:MAG: alpha/beta hydrolase-fold protein [Candidatus Brocadiia bacterium]
MKGILTTASLCSLLLAAVLLNSCTQEKTVVAPAPAAVDWHSPDGIDPLDEASAAYLDTDLTELWAKGEENYKAAKFFDAARYYQAIVRYNRTDKDALFALGRCYAQLENEKLALLYVRRAFRAGFQDVGIVLTDKDFDKIREKEDFKVLAGRVEKYVKGQGECALIEAPFMFRYRIRLPEGYDATKSYPLIVGLHGWGDNPENFEGLYPEFGLDNLIFVSPQAPYAYYNGEFLGYSWFGDEFGEPGHVNQLNVDYVHNLTRMLTAKYKTTGAYLMGFSQGGGMTLMAGIKKPELYKGLIAVGGWLNTEWLTAADISAAKGLKVCILHGTKDPVVPYETATKAQKALVDAGYDVFMFDFDGEHKIPLDGLKKAVEWLKIGG